MKKLLFICWSLGIFNNNISKEKICSSCSCYNNELDNKINDLKKEIESYRREIDKMMKSYTNSLSNKGNDPVINQLKQKCIDIVFSILNSSTI
jgi:hypothetical protein